MNTRFEIIVEHNAPIDPEKMGLMISNSLRPIMEYHNKKNKAQINKSTVNILTYNISERTAIELPPDPGSVMQALSKR